MSIFQSRAIVEHEMVIKRRKFLDEIIMFTFFQIIQQLPLSALNGADKWWGYWKYQVTKKFIENVASKNF